jgi:Amt family ammonium transporter
VCSSFAFSAVGTLVLLKIVDLMIGLRVTKEEEIQGLDLTQHEESGYNL